MTFFFDLVKIAARSIQQRGIASLLTIFSMSLGVMLVVMVLTIHGVVDKSFRNNASLGYNVIVGAKGGKEQLTLNTVYYLSRPVENIPYDFYLEFLGREQRDELLKLSFAHEARQAELAAAAAVDASLLAGDPATTLAAAAAKGALEERYGNRLNLAAAGQPPRYTELGRAGKYARLSEFAIPVCLGDYYGRFRVVGTTPQFFDNRVFDIETGRKFEFAQGRNFQQRSPEHGYFEAVVGATVAREMNVKLGDKINPAHGVPEGHTHARAFTIVGIVAPSGTPNDRAVFINMEGFYLMEDHAKPVEDEAPPPTGGAGGNRDDDEAAQKAWFEAQARRKRIEREPDPEPLPAEQREVTALLVKCPGTAAINLEGAISGGNVAQAVMPVQVIVGMFEFFVKPVQRILLTLTAMICVVSGISILVSIYNSMSERRHEIAVMRALGAGRGTVMSIILLESTLLSLAGGFVGWLAGHLLCLLASPLVEEQTGVPIGFNLWGEPFFQPLVQLGIDQTWAEAVAMPMELLLVPGLVVLAVVVGLWPAIAAYKTDVAQSLGK
ncbi:MAG TPA: ABC transporter permease [Pirellulaceae bacterium]|nr:ABC transporter permease [Pirellulaceae bacterium]